MLGECGERCGKVWKNVGLFPHFPTPPHTLLRPPQDILPRFPTPSTLIPYLFHISFHTLPNSPHFSSPPHLYPNLPSFSFFLPPKFPHSSVFAPYLNQLTKLAYQKSPNSPNIHLLTPPDSPYSSTIPPFFPVLPLFPMSYFIIYPIPKFLIFVIYCQSSLAIKCTRNCCSLNFIKQIEGKNKKWQHNI